MKFHRNPIMTSMRPKKAFTLVELMIAVAVIAVGMVFVLGAFSQCLSALTTARKMVTANYLLNGKLWESDLAIKQEIAAYKRFKATVVALVALSLKAAR